MGVLDVQNFWQWFADPMLFPGTVGAVVKNWFPVTSA